MPRRPKKKLNTFAFVDSQNLNLGTQRMGWKLDWRKFREYLREKHNVSHAYLFIGYMSENESLYEQMHDLGYLVVLKPTIDISGNHHAEVLPEAEQAQKAVKPPEEKEKEKAIIKGNVDAELVLYAMKEMPNYDQAIIVSGDGDFFSLAEYLEEQHKLAHILTPNWQYSSLLKVFEPKIIRLDQLRRQLAYHDHRKKKPTQG